MKLRQTLILTLLLSILFIAPIYKCDDDETLLDTPVEENSNQQSETSKTKDHQSDTPKTEEHHQEPIIHDFTESERDQVQKSSETHSFGADVPRLMDIIINSLYTHKEVFLREIISNAADALEKIRYKSITDDSLLGDQKDLEIMIDFDKDAKTLSVTDTGIGMTKEDLIRNLGTVAKSGTIQFIEAMTKSKNMNLIGQFGVGFYSVFLVANKVVVTSKNNDDDQHVWTSSAGSNFWVTKDPRGNTLKRGTRVTLYLKDDAIEFVEQDRIKKLVQKYSEFMNFPIKVYVSKQVTTEVDDDEAPVEEKKEEESKDKGTDKDLEELEIKEEGEEAKEEAHQKKKKTVTETKWEWETTNENKAIWLRSKDEISEEEYNAFYKSISKDNEPPATFSHFTAEGEMEFKSILYVPSQSPYDLFENYYGRSAALKLYVRRVLITEEFEELMPRYLNFIKGVVDSDDLPLNVNREQLQQLKLVKVMSKKLVRKAIDMIIKLAKQEEEEEEEEDEEEVDEEETQEVGKKEGEEAEKTEEKKNENVAYDKFWKNFGKNIKLGVIEDTSNRNKLAKLLRFYSTKNLERMIGLDEYISRMGEKQEAIFFVPGETKEDLMKSPLIEKFLQKGIEVLLLVDPIDEYCMQHLAEYEKKKIKSVAKGDVNFGDEDKLEKKKEQKLKEIYSPLTKWWKAALGKKVEKVQVSKRLVEDPCIVVTSEYGYSASMERINRAQAFANQEKAASHMLAKKTLEINPSHPVIKELLARVKEDANNTDTIEFANLIYDTALLNSGFLIENSAEMSDKIFRLVQHSLGIAGDAKPEDIEINLDEEEVDSESTNRREDAHEVKEEFEFPEEPEAKKIEL